MTVAFGSRQDSRGKIGNLTKLKEGKSWKINPYFLFIQTSFYFAAGTYHYGLYFIVYLFSIYIYEWSKSIF